MKRSDHNDNRLYLVFMYSQVVIRLVDFVVSPSQAGGIASLVLVQMLSML